MKSESTEMSAPYVLWAPRVLWGVAPVWAAKIWRCPRNVGAEQHSAVRSKALVRREDVEVALKAERSAV